ncbi:MAG TPA: DUF6365 family protein [Acidobacteriota bacterium]|nr:DUF6365 family protein [Acidobacteriota bacterium]
MANRTHLFLATFPASRGEITLALRVANDLFEQGDRIVFLACESDSMIFAGKPYTFVPLDRFLPELDKHMSRLVESHHADSLILVDVLTNSVWLKLFNLGSWFFDQKLVPVLALDVYYLKEDRQKGDVFFDHEFDFSYLNAIPRGRFVPVPFISPDAGPDVYNSVPPTVNVELSRKKEIREELGISVDDKLVLMVGAQWQTPSFWKVQECRRIAACVPNLLTYYLSRVDPKVRVVHIGPEPYKISSNLEGRYLWLPRLDQNQFQALLASADLFLTPNFVGTTLSTAITIGLPMVVVSNSVRAKTVDEAVSKIQGTPSEKLLTWLNAAVPIYPFYCWPIGYHRLVSEMLVNNPFCQTFREAELLHEEAVIEACRMLLFDESERSQLIEAQMKYVEVVRTLPRGADLVNQHLEKI